MLQISTSLKMSSLKIISSSDPVCPVIQSARSSRCALLTYTTEAAFGSQTAEEDEFAVDDCSSYDSGEPSMNWMLFQRTSQVEERRRQSLIAVMLESARKQRPTSDKSGSEVPWSNVQHTPSTHDREKAPASPSPRTTRSNMLTTELAESLRSGLVLERQHGASTTDTVKTSHDSTSLRQFDKLYMKASENVNASLWNKGFLDDASRDCYYSRGR
ncbi:hypothetical protein CDD83_7721 [Cordyceps sp. RAO-2017]|nr:hypothetical protein CDD83_7721 [Cordyceps sp. RAO-2017]